jgi:hypothetical protein
MFNRLKKAYENVGPYVFNRKNAPTIAGSFLLTGAGILTSLGTSYTFSQAVNSAYTGEPAAILGMEFTPYAMIIVSGCVYTANNILSSLNEWLLTPLGPRVSQELVVDHVQELMQKDLAFHLATPFGTHVNRFNKCFTIGNAV